MSGSEHKRRVPEWAIELAHFVGIALVVVAAILLLNARHDLSVQAKDFNAQAALRIGDLRASCRHTSQTDAASVNSYWVNYTTEIELTPPVLGESYSKFAVRARAAFKLREQSDRNAALEYAGHVDPHDIHLIRYLVPREAAIKDAFSCQEAYPEVPR